MVAFLAAVDEEGDRARLWCIDCGALGSVRYVDNDVEHWTLPRAARDARAQARSRRR